MLRLFLLLFLSFATLYGHYHIDSKGMPDVRRSMMIEGNYYDITVNGEHFKGTRLWKERWDILKENIDFNGLKVLDLGTFLGFVPTFALKYGGAIKATGVDRNCLDSAIAFAKGFDVKSEFMVLNFDEDNYESMIGYDYDIVFCMSLYHWVKEKDKLISYLANFDQVIYEGHDTDGIELSRLQYLIDRGYICKKIGVSYSGYHLYTERGRTIFHLYR